METQQSISDYERQRGKPVPSKLHSVAQTNLLIQLASYRPRFQALSELTLRLEGRDLTPDVSVY